MKLFQTLKEDLSELLRLQKELERQNDPTGNFISTEDKRKIQQRIHTLRKRIQNPTTRQCVMGSRPGRLNREQQERVDSFECLRQINLLILD